MKMERTFSIIKPDAVKRNLSGHINQLIEKNNLKIIATKTHNLSKKEAEAFYGVHKERPFFKSLVEFMTSGPVQVQVLEGENAITSYREIMGATNPAEAADGTIRKLFAESIEANSVHGSDSRENASIEIAFFFSGSELI
ncbi:nucleoside-diphosphate kinase [Alphaproteobacteria bacterium]|nr:nucleoside-diphosphate kinase [Alphaproteobacteria bacterium]